MKKKLIFTLQLVATIVVFYLLISSWQISLSGISKIFVQPAWLILCVFFAAVLIPVSAAFRWKLFLNAIGINYELKELMKINFQSIFWGTFLPSSDGFAAIRIYKIEKRHKQDHGKAGSSIIAEKIAGIFCLCLLGLLFSFFVTNIPDIIRIRIIFSFFLLLILFLAFLIFHKKINKFIPGIKPKTMIFRKIFEFIRNMHQTLYNLPLKPTLTAVFPVIIIIQFITFINVYLLFQTSQSDISLLAVLALTPIIQLISLIPITLSGLGIREGAFVYFFGFLGIPAETAFAVSILNFLILNGVPAIIGGLLSLRDQITCKVK